MSDTLHIGINPDQREMLLQGLRFVRSSVLLEMKNPERNETELRNERLKHIEDLVHQLGGARSTAEV